MSLCLPKTGGFYAGNNCDLYNSYFNGTHLTLWPPEVFAHSWFGLKCQTSKKNPTQNKNKTFLWVANSKWHNIIIVILTRYSSAWCAPSVDPLSRTVIFSTVIICILVSVQVRFVVDKCFMTFVTRMLDREHFNPIFLVYRNIEKMSVLTVLFLTGMNAVNWI